MVVPRHQTGVQNLTGADQTPRAPKPWVQYIYRAVSNTCNYIHIRRKLIEQRLIVKVLSSRGTKRGCKIDRGRLIAQGTITEGANKTGRIEVNIPYH